MRETGPSKHPHDFTKSQLQELYRSMDPMLVTQVEVEQAVYFKTADLMNADVDLVFYDTTNIHFEVDEEDESAKEGDRNPEHEHSLHSGRRHAGGRACVEEVPRS
jgi:hypothetical protein